MPILPRAFRSRTSRRSRVAAFVAAGLLAVSAPRLYAQVRVAVVDMQRALLETEQGRRAKNQLKQLFQSRQEELDRRQNALKRMREEIEKQRNTLSREQLQQRMEDYQKQFVDMQQNFLEYQQELAQREAELTKQIYINLQGVIRQIGTQDNYTAIFEQGGVVWAPQHLDLTDRVVQAYNQRFPPQAQAPAAPGGQGNRPAGGVQGNRPAGGAPARGQPAGGAGRNRPPVNPHPRGENQPPAGR